MQSAFPIVVFGAVAVSVVMSLVFLFTRESVHEEIGQGGMSPGGGFGGAPGSQALDSAAERAERELEIRQMLGARSERLIRAGKPALDIDAEVAQLLGPTQGGGHDAGLTEEVRQLVVARNERRARQGLEPLEVEAEVSRTLEELSQ